MEPTPGESGLAANTPVTAEESIELVSYSRALEDVSFGAIADSDVAQIQWATPDGLETVGRGVAVRLSASGPARFDRIRSQAETVLGELDHNGPAVARPRAFGGFAFHDEREPGTPWNGFASASFVVPHVLLTRSPDDDATWLTVVGDDTDGVRDALEEWSQRVDDYPTMRASGRSPGVDSTRRTTTPDRWDEQVDGALERIADGSLTKVVLAQALTVDLEEPVDVSATVERLRRRYPNCYRFLVNGGDGATFFGAPPERLVSKRNTRVETEALAGSVPRGETPEADDEYADQLLADEKLRHEHELVVDAICTQLESFVSDLSVADRTIRRLANIQHLLTPISATLETDHHVLELVETLHPTPAVGGVPPEVAWETIRETESFDRGWYAGPVGWFDAAGDGEFAVGLRSGVASDETVTLFAGSGIVADSDPTAEWEEVQLKFRPVLDELR
ncbi:isochorismate synthase [Natrarchaeobaculum sulfurireducens]|uniref:isochorismate synthase n=1 Tax=Natrarchaeobaculum sulfurireducens TaxID=2044521 RepID=A0A346PQT8_9EURY|nr:isochorismate synthase [Natrarchaeobaculum sulfurireducens]AXR78128.1 Menaquinone-specific isochorismate synthase [Natrarchaeobaculum sulfurireducens]AXR81883.1 Isochorismate synthase / Menaquinone-specific isochorismate synthase [Natrarchaeobaculum sulfurireducens]